jgi:hypothetical protein
MPEKALSRQAPSAPLPTVRALQHIPARSAPPLPIFRVSARRSTRRAPASLTTPDQH